MVKTDVIVDTGPIVALLVPGDQHHAWAREQWTKLKPPLLSCEAVLSEAQHIISRLGGEPQKVLEFVHRGLLDITFQAGPETKRLIALQRSYADLPMSFADACLVRMSELASRPRVMTTDSDFLVYRRNRRQVIPLLAPDAIERKP